MALCGSNGQHEWHELANYKAHEQALGEEKLTREQLQRKIYREMQVRMKREDKQIGLWCLEKAQESISTLPLWQSTAQEMEHSSMYSAQVLLRENSHIYEAFKKFTTGKLSGDIDRFINSMSAATWKAFTRSPQAKSIDIDLSLYTPVPILQAKDVTPKPPATPKPTPIPVREDFDERDEVPESIPVPVPLQISPPLPHPTQTPESALFDLIAKGLQGTNFKPQESVTAEQCRSIAEDTVLELAEQIKQELLTQGYGTQKQLLQIQLNGKVLKEVEGRTPKYFKRLYKLYQCRVPALLVGPAGCGKTTAVKMLAELEHLPFHRVSIAAGTDEGQLQGWLHPSSEGMRFEYVCSVVSKAYEEGGIVLIDDVDLGDANALGILNATLDNGGWHIPLRHKNPVFHRHRNFWICFAANTWGHGADRKFVGANQLDERTLSRTRMGQIACDYDEDLERSLYDKAMVNFGQLLRNRCRKLPGFLRDVSTRDIEFAHVKLQAFTEEEAWYEYFQDWKAEELQRVHVQLNHDAETVALL